jgi:opacity protein-like surface antigen
MRNVTIPLVALGLLAGTSAAWAQDTVVCATPTQPTVAPAPPPPQTTYVAPQTTYVEEQPGVGDYSWYEPSLLTGIGVGIIVGGGISGFQDQSLRDAMADKVQGTWNGLVSIGTHIPLGIDLSYVGTADDVRQFRGQSNGTLIGTAVEGALRLNLVPHYAVNPYIFGGVGWQHYDVHNMAFATADTGMMGSDDEVEFPVGAGISFRDVSGWLLDLRGSYHAFPTSTLVRETNGGFADNNYWTASANLGFEF